MLAPQRRARPGLLVIVAALAGCASSPPQPESMRDPAADFGAYATFGWGMARAGSAEEPVRLLDSNIRAAIAAEMKRRGYTEVPEGAALLMHYQTASAEKIESNPVRVGIGMGSWGGSFGGSVNVGSPSVRNYREGTLVIHAVDAARNAEVWQGRISGRIAKGSLEPAAINAAVATAMRDFPARPAP